MHSHFPDPDLAAALLPHAFDIRDGAHDEAHLLRVWRNVCRIVAEEGGNLRLLQAATLLHDCIWVDKAAPERPLASRMAAAKARDVLSALGWSGADTDRVAHAIEAHSFSAGIAPQTLEARILQDADRLDAMGAIGVARCLWLAGARGAAICDATDPAATARPLDDAAFALDHFQTKLLHLGETLTTAKGRALAEARAARLRAFYEGLLDEVG
ncbi:MAG: HD domain-containing protein [Rhodobacteraceae bacterium]|nr:HD domain-containing protein [Paracoccaceae bacterium]MBR9820799.1 HD domain-containing protein [Paracoccaceae bacterium]